MKKAFLMTIVALLFISVFAGMVSAVETLSGLEHVVATDFERNGIDDDDSIISNLEFVAAAGSDVSFKTNSWFRGTLLCNSTVSKSTDGSTNEVSLANCNGNFKLSLTVMSAEDADSYNDYSGKPITDANGRKIVAGVLTINGTQNYNVVYTNAPLLEINKVIVTVDDDSDSYDSDESGETFDDVKPGSHVSVELVLKNLIDSNVDNDKIEDINIEILAYSMEDEGDDDFEDDDEISRISGEDKFSVFFEFDVPEELTADDYDVVLKNVRGVDEFGGIHYVEDFTFSLDVVRERNSIEIKSVRFTSSKLSCGQTSAQLYVQLQNTGERNQDDVVIRIEQPELNIEYSDVLDDELVSVEEDVDDSKYSKTFTLTVPKTAKAGKYLFTVNSFFDSNILSDSSEVLLEIGACQTEQTTTTTVTPPVTTTPQEVIPEVVSPDTSTPETTTETTTGTVTEEQSAELTGSPLYTSLLVLANVGLVVVIVGLGVKLFKRD